MADVQIDEVHTEIEITETVGSLSPAEVKKLVGIVLEQMKAQQERAAMRRRDDTVGERAYMPGPHR
jgi:hypothetical protein